MKECGVDRVAVIGGGLAGLACAAALGSRGFRVTVLESRRRLGGRASSFADPDSGQLVDACQHVSMGCCTNLDHFFGTIGVSHLLSPQPRLHFVTPDRKRSVFKADPWPAPFHLGRALMGAHYLTPAEKLRVAWGFLALLREKPDADPPLRDWLLAHRQTERTISRFWGVVLVSALNETVDRLGLKYARKVLVDGFMRHRDGFVVHLPTVPLGRLYGEELSNWFGQHGVEVRENAAVRSVVATRDGVQHLAMRDGTTVNADWFVLAVPFERVADLLPESLVAQEPYFGNIANLTPSPITSVHLWFDREVQSLPHAVLVDCLGHWVFNRGEVTPGEFYLQVVISATRALRELGHDEIRRRIVTELGQVFPALGQAKVLRSKVVTEHTATFSAVPGVDQWRPPQASPVPNLAVAGDWTATGWPATMEGAVRSGYLAAEAILARAGRPQRILRPDLGTQRHARPI
ncbi:MAG: Carotene 7,8-desaturase [Planctomycetaceae bacterium]|nr:Carotene 7,8-desaturase [Planctomycetaceae bacterium]